MPHIRILPDFLANQIAAGEVVGRPSSVVKELIDNAIDANSKNIIVTIKDGGKSYIKIKDDGIGMEKDDLAMSIKRHATSKLHSNNLHSITTCGFRGEALASIASVANLSITTKYKDSNDAYTLYFDSDMKEYINISKGDFGTTIIVEDLFVHIPARQKFLKSDLVEKSHIISVIKEIALCNHMVGIDLYDEDRKILSYKPVCSSFDRIKQVFDSKFHKNLHEFEYKSTHLNVHGFLGLPTFIQSSSINQHIFINNRPVKEKAIYSAIKASYANVMSHGFFAAVVLYITVDPFEIDVNVHPAKTEVRLRDAALMRSEMIKAIKGGLNNMPVATSSSITENFISQSKRYTPNFQTHFPKQQTSFIKENHLHFAESPKHTLGNQNICSIKVETTGILGSAMFQIDKKYIISRTENELIIIDQHAAHERIIMHKMQNNHQLESETLLFPIILELSSSLIHSIAPYLEILTEYGFNLSVHGSADLLVRSIPTFLPQNEAKNFLTSFLHELAEHESPQMLLAKKDKIIADIACHNSIRAGQEMSVEKMNALLREIEATPLASQCNHGRPTFVKLAIEDLDKIFQRI